MKYLGIVFVAFLFISCVNDEDGEENIFGYEYRILESGEYPVIRNDSLLVRLGYSGCNGGHKFLLRSKKSDLIFSEICLYKETADQPCDAYFEETLHFELNNEISNSESIILIGPNDFRVTLKE